MSRSHDEIGRAVAHSWEASAFFGAIMAGTLLGFLGDHFLGTDPWLVVIGIISGSATGFWRMWQYATKDIDA